MTKPAGRRLILMAASIGREVCRFNPVEKPDPRDMKRSKSRGRA
jgi:hypothetical protein